MASMEKFLFTFQSEKDWKKCFGLLVWKKKIIFQSWIFLHIFHN